MLAESDMIAKGGDCQLTQIPAIFSEEGGFALTFEKIFDFFHHIFCLEQQPFSIDWEGS